VNGFFPELRYQFSEELLDRRKVFRSLLRRSLSGVRHMLMTHAPEPNFSHACGTARFGADERTSVLDPDCKAHDLSNLYVVDSSFMPTSTGVNPSLCIAANALRVADALAARAE
jgi:choline dehydrogenase-like flavoprotein